MMVTPFPMTVEPPSRHLSNIYDKTVAPKPMLNLTNAVAEGDCLAREVQVLRRAMAALMEEYGIRRFIYDKDDATRVRPRLLLEGEDTGKHVHFTMRLHP